MLGAQASRLEDVREVSNYVAAIPRDNAVTGPRAALAARSISSAKLCPGRKSQASMTTE